ncbi:exocyst complex component EXO70H1-like [Carica papaya]|uniref:exocyst complex component EXO70H1-like n=1 Tax=Carica papaya TaxID=3649 RepID=UPI000B8CE724|nr:exocyst complex component EXO70H1-like [Carica papaya]
MPRKGMRSLCFVSKTPSFAVGRDSSPSKASISTPRRNFSESMVDQSIEAASAIINKWDPDTSTFAKRSLALNSLIRLSDSVRLMLADFESSIQKDSSKLVVPGGGLHPLTISSMSYLSLLADYSNILTDILIDWPPPEKPSSPDFYFDSPVSDDSSAPAISLQMAWLILVLLCKLDSKAKYYKDVSTSYLFLANNLQHVVGRVRASNLQYLLGEEWITKHEAKLKQFTASYERLAWGPVLESLPVQGKERTAMTPGEAKQCFNRFNDRFEEAYQKQRSCIVSDQKLRDEIKNSIAGKLVPAYREFYRTHKLNVRATEREERNIGWFVRFTPEDVENYLYDLFFGMTDSGNSSTTSSPSSSIWRQLLSPLRN